MKTVVILCAACGIGKSTMKDFIEENNLLPEWVCLDTDDVGLNWWDYAGTIAALQNADLSKYKDSMRPLIEKDIQKTITEISK